MCSIESGKVQSVNNFCANKVAILCSAGILCFLNCVVGTTQVTGAANTFLEGHILASPDVKYQPTVSISSEAIYSPRVK
jgi:hypothetical protein